MSAGKKAREEKWQAYKKRKTRKRKEALIESFLPVVEEVASSVFARVPRSVEYGDLVGSGTLGLIHAIRTFDETKGPDFESYCAFRVRGAILDGLRRMDSISRQSRSRIRKVKVARERLRMALGREPSGAEVAAKLGITHDEYSEWMRKGTPPMSIEGHWNVSRENRTATPLEILVDDNSENPDEDMRRRDFQRDLTRGLTAQEKELVRLYYFEENTMERVGDLMNLSESRVSQLHSRILERLKARFKHEPAPTMT
jgi:RNA polymerase sigma factor for flagellar operon FliA